MRIWFRLALSLALFAFSGSAFGHYKPSPTTSGKYTNWGGQINELDIVAPFKLADYRQIVVEPLDTSSTPLPDERDTVYVPVKEMLSQVTTPFVMGLSDLLPKISAKVEPGGGPAAGALVIRGKVLTMDPGVKAPHYSVNGSGRSRTVIAGEVVDGGTGKTLLRFRQERRFGATGATELDSNGGEARLFSPRARPLSGSDEPRRAMGVNLRLIGRDIGDVLRSF